MLEILAITLPIFLLIGTGFTAARTGLLSRDNLQGVGSFVMYLALPALIIRALTDSPLAEVFNPTYLLAYGLGSLAAFLVGLALSVGLRGKRLEAGALHALGMSASNSGFIGYPVALMAIGPPAAIFMALNMVVETLFIIPSALILAEASRQQGGLGQVVRQTAARLARNPVLLGLLVGLTLALSGLRLPGPLQQVIEMLADAAGPAALFTIGGMLHGLKVRGMAADMGQVVVGKLLLHPLAVLACFLLLPDPDPLMIAAGLLFACAPMISVYPLFGRQYGQGETSAAALMVGTLASFLTISLVLWGLSRFGLLPA